MHGFWKLPLRLVFKCAFMKSLITMTLAALLLPGLIFAQSRNIDTEVIPDFNLSKYLGTWYEIARFDHSFEKNMDNVTAEYVLRPDGKVDVINSGWRNGLFKVANGKAKQPDPVTSPAHLMVSFFLFFYSVLNTFHDKAESDKYLRGHLLHHFPSVSLCIFLYKCPVVPLIKKKSSLLN